MPKPFDRAFAEATDTFVTYSDSFFIGGITAAEKLTKNQPIAIKLAASGIFGVAGGAVGRVAGILGGSFTFFFHTPAFNQQLDASNKKFNAKR